jgi:periplasmic copper chaperone A
MKPHWIAALLLAAGAAQAHVTLDVSEAVAGKPFKTAFKVGHGCDGAATTQLTVRLPAGLRAAKPVPKPGWRLSLQHTAAGELVAVTWTAQTAADALQDDWYDEFVLRAVLPAEPGELSFAVRQDCGAASADWSGPAGSDTPAARLRVLSPNQPKEAP